MPAPEGTSGDWPVLRCAAWRNGRHAGQCPSAADWQCLRCGLGYCHRHALYHRAAQAGEPRPGPEAARRQIGLARLLPEAASGPPPD